MDNKSNHEQGIALIVALFFLLILSLLGLCLLLNTEMENATSNNYSKTVKATYAAQAGLERVKPYLIYDFAEDPEGWSNEILLVPFGTTGSSDGAGIGHTGHGYFDLSQGGAITVPSDTPYDVIDALADAQNPTLFAAVSSPSYMPEAGYQILLRNIPPGVHANDQICVQSIGYTGKAKTLSGIGTRGTNVLEACYTADLLSIWDNIVFGETGDVGGGGAMELHGNIHVLGEGLGASDTSYESKGSHFNCYDCGKTTLTDVPFDIYLNTFQATRATLDATFRVRNGLADLDNGAACVGCPSDPNYAGAYVCLSCGASPHEGYTSTNSENAVSADENEGYDIPSELQSIIDFPEVTDPYIDTTTGVEYDNYSDYLIGDEDTTPFQPGVLGVKTRLPFGVATVFDFTNSTTLANLVWTNKDALFLYNVNTNAAGVNRAQVPLDPVGLDENPDEADPVFTPTIQSNHGFLLVGADLTQGVVIVYKETQSFTRDGITHPRQVHGFVFAPDSANMASLVLQVDLDGADLDLGDGTQNYTSTLSTTDSNNLVRKVVNALWLSAQKACGSPSCYSSADHNMFHSTINLTDISDNDAGNGNLDTATTGSILVAYGVIQTTDNFTIGGNSDKVTYLGRMTLFVDDPVGSVALLKGDIVPVRRHTSGGKQYAFPCENNMGILGSDDVDFEKQPHTDKVGAFFAADTMYVEKQFQILGAMVADQWDFKNGGNPDMFQAMEMAQCLPPYMIGDKLIPFLSTTRFVER